MFYFGVDYYPEHWPAERWPQDARLMAEAGFNVVRLAEFAWARLEPRVGEYCFDWLDQAIALLAAHGMRIVLGTPTASPPAWLMAGHPELFRAHPDGRATTYGNRREYCPNNPVYREHSHRIVSAMAEHYAAHPAVIGWQIDNEFGERCYCPRCAWAFRDWLRCRYASLDELNQAWGAVFWSHTYGDWEEIPLPLASGGSPNPGLALDFFRFVSDSYVSYQQEQVQVLRSTCPRHFITHNFMGFKFDRINYFDLAGSLDLVAWDNYPRTQWAMQAQVDSSQAALAADTMRGLKRRNFWVMEQQAGPGGWEIVSVAPRPGELRLWAYQSIAHGADAVVFFRWRTSRFGTEQYWHGLLDHDGRPSRWYQEARRMGAELAQIGDRISGSLVKPAVAMLLSYDARFAFQIQANNPQFCYADHFRQFYRAFFQRHVAIDIVDPTGDLAGYQLVVAPALHVVSPAMAANLERYVRAGGTLVLTPRTGVKDACNAVFDGRLPGLLAELCGLEVEEYDSLSHDMHNELQFTPAELGDGSPLPVGTWCDVLQPRGAAVVARYTRDHYAGKAAITLTRIDATPGGRPGQVVYVGALGDEHLYERLAGWLLDLAGVQPVLAAPPGVEVAERWQGNQRLLFLLNHSGETQEVVLGGRYTNLLDESGPIQDAVSLASHEVAVLVAGA